MMRHALIAAEKIVEKYAKKQNYLPPYSLAEVDEVSKIVEEAGNLMVADALAKVQPVAHSHFEPPTGVLLAGLPASIPPTGSADDRANKDREAVKAEQFSTPIVPPDSPAIAASKEKPATTGAAGKK